MENNTTGRVRRIVKTEKAKALTKGRRTGLRKTGEKVNALKKVARSAKV